MSLPVVQLHCPGHHPSRLGNGRKITSAMAAISIGSVGTASVAFREFLIGDPLRFTERHRGRSLQKNRPSYAEVTFRQFLRGNYRDADASRSLGSKCRSCFSSDL